MISYLTRQNRAYRDALASEYCALPTNRSTLDVAGYKQSMSRHTGGERAWLALSNGGYCLVAKTRRVFVSDGNPLAVGHKMPEVGLYDALDLLLPFGANVLELGAGQGPLKAYFNRQRVDLVWEAVDAALNVETYTHGLVGYHDICAPWPTKWDAGRVDYIVSIEMAEHINPECESNLSELLSQARKGVILSWSTAHLPLAHPNARPNSHVINLLDSVGFEFEKTSTEESRKLLNTGIKASFMVFVKQSKVPALRVL